jgi:hypothetical protein
MRRLMRRSIALTAGASSKTCECTSTLRNRSKPGGGGTGVVEGRAGCEPTALPSRMAAATSDHTDTRRSRSRGMASPVYCGDRDEGALSGRGADQARRLNVAV